ncbi:Putative laccase family protein [Zea mays]|uniref:laccase n=1 Tax=Zea mays TaxID=4577 RepID=A0A1D6PNB7_MAIZE|nr:Putative laccase family protein [Zea mays]
MKPFLLSSSLPAAAAHAVVVVVAAISIVVLSATSMMPVAAVEHTFVVSQVKMTRMCKQIPVTVVNGQLPGPTIEVTEGHSVTVHVVNMSPYNLTIHWHGVYQLLNCWNDGVPMVTQRPIPPNANFTYRFDVAGQEGTLWWHAHDAFLRATVYGALIIRPRNGAASYPFPKPHKEIPILIGEWWEKDLAAVDRNFTRGHYDEFSSGSTINGKLGDLFNCSGVFEDGYVLDVEPGKTYLLRVINAALFSEYFIKIAGHKFTVVAADANYVTPYATDVIVIAPGETMDALVIADAAPVHRQHQHTRNNKSSPVDDDDAVAPDMPDQHDTIKSFYFHGNLTGLRQRQRQRARVPARADERLLVTLGLGSICRLPGRRSCKRGDHPESMVVANMNNVSFHDAAAAAPLLEAHYYHRRGGNGGVGTAGLPDRPPSAFNYTDPALIPFGPQEMRLEPTRRATAVRRFRHGAVVDVVFQSTAMLQGDSNPMHLHGHDMFVLAQGIGNYDAATDEGKYNLVNPPRKNTVLVPNLGWAAIRFVADNPGAWFIHCHFEFHLAMGMAAVFIVEDGPTPNTSLPPPPPGFLDGRP